MIALSFLVVSCRFEVDMNEEKRKKYSEDLLEFSDKLVTREYGSYEYGWSYFFEFALTGCLALVLAGIPAFAYSIFVDGDGSLFVFCALIVFFGCVFIEMAITNHSKVQLRLVDNINALRVVVLDHANRVRYYDN